MKTNTYQGVEYDIADDGFGKHEMNMVAGSFMKDLRKVIFEELGDGVFKYRFDLSDEECAKMMNVTKHIARNGREMYVGRLQLGGARSEPSRRMNEFDGRLADLERRHMNLVSEMSSMTSRVGRLESNAKT